MTLIVPHYTNHERYWMQAALTQLFWYCTISLITYSFRTWLMWSYFFFWLDVFRWWLWIWIYYYGKPLDIPQPSTSPFLNAFFNVYTHIYIKCTYSFAQQYWCQCSVPEQPHSLQGKCTSSKVHGRSNSSVPIWCSMSHRQGHMGSLLTM